MRQAPAPIPQSNSPHENNKTAATDAWCSADPITLATCRSNLLSAIRPSGCSYQCWLPTPINGLKWPALLKFDQNPFQQLIGLFSWTKYNENRTSSTSSCDTNKVRCTEDLDSFLQFLDAYHQEKVKQELIEGITKKLKTSCVGNDPNKQRANVCMAFDEIIFGMELIKQVTINVC